MSREGRTACSYRLSSDFFSFQLKNNASLEQDLEKAATENPALVAEVGHPVTRPLRFLQLFSQTSEESPTGFRLVWQHGERVLKSQAGEHALAWVDATKSLHIASDVLAGLHAICQKAFDAGIEGSLFWHRRLMEELDKARIGGGEWR